MRDPLGRQALFSPPAPPVGAGGNGKQSLYSAKPATSPWAVFAVDCSSCGARSHVTGLELMARHLPFWLWVPWQRYSHLMSCPACGQRTWLAVTLSL